MNLELNTRYGAELTMTTDHGQLVETIYNRETNINSDVINNVSNVLLDMLEAYTGKEYYDPELLTKLTSNCYKVDGFQGLKDIFIDLDIDLEEFSNDSNRHQPSYRRAKKALQEQLKAEEKANNELFN